MYSQPCAPSGNQLTPYEKLVKAMSKKKGPVK
jgi:hypothetical protein